MEIQKDNETEQNTKKEVEVPNLIGMTVKDAKKLLEELKLGLEYEETDEDISNKVITSQIPVEGVKIYEDTNVIVN